MQRLQKARIRVARTSQVQGTGTMTTPTAEAGTATRTVQDGPTQRLLAPWCGAAGGPGMTARGLMTRGTMSRSYQTGLTPTVDLWTDAPQARTGGPQEGALSDGSPSARGDGTCREHGRSAGRTGRPWTDWSRT